MKGTFMVDGNGTQAQAEEILDAAIGLAQQKWLDRLIAAYALGSLAHGGFRPLVSDIDIGFVLEDPLLPSDANVIEGVVSAIEASRKPFSDRLSIFWGRWRASPARAPAGATPAGPT